MKSMDGSTQEVVLHVSTLIFRMLFHLYPEFKIISCFFAFLLQPP